MLEPAAPPAEPVPKVYRPKAPGALARVGLSVATFFLALAALRAVAAPAGGGSIGGKLEYWREHAREYDTVFLGSSHVLRAFVPEEFDAAAADHGFRSRSFNFGVQASHLLEQRWLLGAILDAHPGLQRVFFEYQWLTPQIDPQNAFNPRTVYWHDCDTTGIAVERALHWGEELGPALRYVDDPAQRHSIFRVVQGPLPAGMRIAGEHVEHWLFERLMIGRGKDVLRGLFGRAHGEAARFREGDGYVSLEEDERLLAARGEARNTYSLRRERFLAEQEDYRRAVDELDAAPVSFGDGDWVDGELTRVDDLELVSAMARETMARGVEFVLVILPSQSGNRPFEERLAAELGALVLRYNLPERFPALYDPVNRYDSGHLSEAGAHRFSRLLARDYAGQRGQPRDGVPLEGRSRGGSPQ